MINRKSMISILAILLTINSAKSIAQDQNKYMPPEAGPHAKLFENENDPIRKKALSEKLIKECPFRRNNSELDIVITESVNLQLSSNVQDSKYNQCSSQLKYFNESISRTAELKSKLDIANSRTTQMTAEEQASLKKEIEVTQFAANSFNNLLQLGCEFKNGTNDISNLGYRLINIMDIASNVFMANPASSIVASTAALSGRLVVSLSQWIFNQPNDNELLTKEANDSKRFVNDLCLFRTLAYKYDDLYVDPFENPQDELLKRQTFKNEASARVNTLRQCVTPPPNEPLANLTAFSRELISAIDATTNQKQCISLISKFNSPGSIHLKNLAKTYGCPTPAEKSPLNTIAFCKNFRLLEDFSTGDTFEKCEEDEFQKKVVKKFTTMSEILFQSAQEAARQSAFHVKEDDLQRLRQAEQEERIAIQRYASLQAILEDSPMTHANSAKSMLSLGRTILGKRFDEFAKETIKSTEKNISAASQIINPLVSKMKKAEKISDSELKDQTKKIICTSISQARQQLAISYHSSIGMNDICLLTKGQGIPPLKSKSLSFDNYSSENKKRFGLFKNDRYLTERCIKIDKKIADQLKDIKTATEKIDRLDCK
jgi:hypothetical protein